MADIDMSRLDLNLLKVFDTLMLCRSVSEAARQLHLSQSTVSHALARLRDQLGDPLFVAGRSGMQPSPRAQALAPAFRQALTLVDDALAQAPAFDPASSERRFTLAAGSYVDMVLLPPLMAALMAKAPGVSLRLRVLGQSDYEQELERGELDLVLGFNEPAHLSPRLEQQPLVTESVSLLSGRPLAAPTPAKLGSLQYIYPSDWGHSQLLLDHWLQGHGIQRQIRLQVPDFQAIPGVLASTELVVVVPSAVAGLYARQHGLHAYPLAASGLSFTQVMAWHPRFAQDPGLHWLKEQILDVASGV
ncbi:LysR family transcriptional regulator [Gallaecimonas kandeliae]|uniref:LysR family transcriptional regulator n=1 Tax=Gallaecimonas kandeliae TaxID=3029055 RepID=UPI0026484335|nr:LysR family transcriptional regulator [Gallaecimonas kandeliae]WKE65363.1 LysR family transcriptional regulator [Gallaecimonas kandeliae]